jgi:hypothetical protein
VTVLCQRKHLPTPNENKRDVAAAIMRVSPLPTAPHVYPRDTELSPKARRIGARVSGPTLLKAASNRRKPRSADCIRSNTFRRTSASRISLGSQALATVFCTPRYSRLPSGSALAWTCRTSASRSSPLTSRLWSAICVLAFFDGTALDRFLAVSWPGLKLVASLAESPSQTTGECS